MMVGLVSAKILTLKMASRRHSIFFFFFFIENKSLHFIIELSALQQFT